MTQENPFKQSRREVESRLQDVEFDVCEVIDVLNEEHAVQVQVRGDEASTFAVPVLVPFKGSVMLPSVGDLVIVVYGKGNRAACVGVIYDDFAEVPKLPRGTIRFGNGSGSYIELRPDGTIIIKTNEDGVVDIDKQAGAAYLSANQSISGGNVYQKVNINTVNFDDANLFEASNNRFVVKHEGIYNLIGKVRFDNPDQGRAITTAVFVNGSPSVTGTGQTTNNNVISVRANSYRRLERGDVVELYVRKTGQARDVAGGNVDTTELSLARLGV